MYVAFPGMLSWSSKSYGIESSVRTHSYEPSQMLSPKRQSNKKNYNGANSVALPFVYTPSEIQTFMLIFKADVITKYLT